MKDSNDLDNNKFSLSDIIFRPVRKDDVQICADIEKDSYPSDEMASIETLNYRQQNATNYFRCATKSNNEENSTSIIGFICATRCYEFTKESMYSEHVENGPILAIHSVVVQSSYRRQGIATNMIKDYIQSTIVHCDENPIKKIVLLSKSHLLGFYVNCGFQVKRPSSISHGKDQWFELEIDIDIQTDGKKFQCFIVDAFADPNKIGTGNPAAVVILDTSTLKQRNMVNDEQSLAEYTTQWMQTIANEFNLSETAFIWPRQNKDRDDTSNDGILSYNIRYFTPTVEVALCGHATLASSSVLFQKELEQNPNTAMVRSCTVEFHTIGNLALKTNLASFVENRTDIEMSLPSLDTQEINSSNERQIITQMLSNAVGIDSESILFLGIADEIDDLLVEVTYESFMQIPYTGIDYSAFLIWKGSSRGVIISCLGTSTTSVKMDAGIDFYSRFFGPACGIDEDPVTGSAHCALVPYYSKRLDGKRSMLAYQKSKRGGLIQCLLSDNTKLVKLTGTAINAVTGTLCW